MASPKPPTGLQPPGRSLWRAMHAALPQDVEYDERELAILAQACRQADAVASLDAVLKRDGLTVVGSQGQPRLHPAVTELRQGRIALARLLGDVELPDGKDELR